MLTKRERAWSHDWIVRQAVEYTSVIPYVACMELRIAWIDKLLGYLYVSQHEFVSIERQCNFHHTYVLNLEI